MSIRSEWAQLEHTNVNPALTIDSRRLQTGDARVGPSTGGRITYDIASLRASQVEQPQ